MAFPKPPKNVEYQLLHWNDDRAPFVSAYSIASFSAAFIAVSLRLIARKIAKVPLKQDDYLIVVALVFALGLLVESLLAAQHGLGKHDFRAGVDNIVYVHKVTFAIQLTYVFCHLPVKMSILFFYHRLFPANVTPRFTYAFYAIGGYVVAWVIYSFFGILFQCTPVNYSWNAPRGDIQGHCISYAGAFLGAGITNTVSDFAVLILPMPIVWSLKLPKRQKLIVCGIFLLGSLACAASIARLVSLVHSALGPDDWTYNIVEPVIWTIVEPTVAIVSACLPMLRPLFESLYSQISSLSRRASARKYPSFTPVNRPSTFSETAADASVAIEEGRGAWWSKTTVSDTVTTIASGRQQLRSDVEDLELLGSSGRH